VAGVGLTSGAKNVQWFFFLRVMVGWAAIFLSACIGSAGVFAFIAFSPSIAPPVEQIN
jgi:phosphate/sulfate permease